MKLIIIFEQEKRGDPCLPIVDNPWQSLTDVHKIAGMCGDMYQYIAWHAS